MPLRPLVLALAASTLLLTAADRPRPPPMEAPQPKPTQLEPAPQEARPVRSCRVDARTRHAREVVEQLREHSGSLVYHTVIRENIRLAECPSFGQPITQYDPKSAGAADYRALAQEIISQEGS